MWILVVNTGSSSLKLRLLAPDDQPIADSHIEDWDGRDVGPIADLIDEQPAVDAVGHRIVHGGAAFHEPVLIDDDVVQRLDDLVPLAPLHQPRALAGLAAARAVLPEVPQVACFDTGYHGTMPAAAATYALPADWRRRWPLRRYGFHGLSHAYAARRAAELSSTGSSSSGELRVASCHLGAGASLCASLGGRSLDTTMGFTPLEGLVMGTRAGSIDPGLVLWLITDAGLSPVEVRNGLEHLSGLSGLAGTADMRQVLDRCRSGDDEALEAFEVYVHALSRHVGAMTVALAGLDVLVFTGGVGERAPEVRSAAVRRLSHLGVAVDPELNASATGPGDHDITTADAPVRSLVIEAREDLEIARQARSLLGR